MLSIALIAGCSTQGVPSVPAQINLDIVHPSGPNSFAGFSVDRVDYRITCPGTAPGSMPIPPADTTGAPVVYDDAVDVSGGFEIIDTRTPAVWQAAVDLTPGDCTMTLSVWDGDEIVCVGSQTLTVVENVSTQFDVVLVCSVSVDLPDGRLNVDGTFSVVTGNLCPLLQSLAAIPSTVGVYSVPPQTLIEYRSTDPNGSCGANCKPETCDNSVPPICTPSVYNPADPRCNPAFGGDPLNLACQDGTASGLVCTLTATSTATAAPGGNFIDPVDGVTQVGPAIAVNLDDFGLDGLGVAVPGLDIQYVCDPSLPGSVTMTVDCGDGDPLCDRVETTTVTCPGNNFCESNPITCTAPNDCSTSGVCDPLCDPATTCIRCAGQSSPLPSGTPCASNGGTLCNGLGACVECVSAAQCDASPIDCREPAQCSLNVCQPRALSPVGTPCSKGVCDAAGVCQFIDPPAQTRVVSLGCTDSVTSDVSIVPFDLTVDPPAVVSGAAIAVTFDGVARFGEGLLDAVQLTVPGGVTQIDLVDLQATVHVRAGGSGADVPLGASPIPTTCGGGVNAGLPCTPGNEAVDCPPGLPSVSCSQFVAVPAIDGTGDACAACDAISPSKAAQCAANGFCVSGALPLPLAAATGTYTVDPSGQMRFGWDDASTGATVNVDGTYALPPALFANPTGPNGIRVNASGLAVGVECTMAVASDDPVNGVGVAGLSSPTPDALLVSFPIQGP